MVGTRMRGWRSQRIPKEYRDLSSHVARFIAKGQPQIAPFDILKKINIVNFEWVEVVRDFQTAEAWAEATC
jgi:hypothetical protein